MKRNALVVDAPGKSETAEAAQAVLQDRERLPLTVFHRRPEKVGDIAVTASHAFTVLDREVLGTGSAERRSHVGIACPGGYLRLDREACWVGLRYDRSAWFGGAVARGFAVAAITSGLRMLPLRHHA